MASFFRTQQRSTAARHHSADFLLARTGLSSTSTQTGFVWLDGKTRRHTHELLSTGTVNVTSCSLPSATISFLATALPLTTTSTGTLRVLSMRERSRSQYGFAVSGRLRIASVAGVGAASSSADTVAFTSTVPALSSLTSLFFSPTPSPFTRKSSKWLLPSLT